MDVAALLLAASSYFSAGPGPAPADPIYQVADADMPISVLILKHSKEKMADDDAKMVVDAVEKASRESLDVELIGNHFINNTRRIRVVLHEYDEIESLKDFIGEQLRRNRRPDSTCIVFTVGHGSTSGYLHNLGDRSEMQKAIAEAAEETGSKVLWWQLSCYASARLPPLDTLTPRQQELMSVLNTSNETTPSPAYIEGKIMEDMFSAMISGEMDANGDMEISGDEFRTKMNDIKKGRGDLFRTHDMSAPLFGISLAAKIKVWDVEKKEYAPRGFVPFPSAALKKN